MQKLARFDRKRVSLGIDGKRGLFAIGVSFGYWKCGDTLSIAVHIGPLRAWVALYIGKPLNKEASKTRRDLIVDYD